jgi:hypothetical protein
MIEAMGRCSTAAVPVFDFGQLHPQCLENGMDGQTVLNGRGVPRTTREVRKSHPEPPKENSGVMEQCNPENWNNGTQDGTQTSNDEKLK